MSAQPTLGFIGVGVMGQGMCRNLALKSGCRVLAADTDPAKVARLGNAGVVAAGIGDLRREAETVFLSLPSIEQVEEVCLGAAPLVGPGSSVRTIVDMSTSDVQRTRRLARHLAEHGVRFLDAPVARSRGAANNGTLLITVGGEHRLFEEVLPWLECMGSDVVHCGAAGCGQVVKTMNNMVLLSTVNSLAEAMAIAEAAGVDKAMLASVLKLGSADSFGLRLTGEKFLARDEFPEGLFPVAYALKDLRLALALADEYGIRPQVATATADILARAAAQGYAANYYPVIYRLVRP